MLDFEKELDKLLALEKEPLRQTVTDELAASEVRLLTSINKKQADISMQVEEIYDIVQDIDVTALKDEIKDEKLRSGRLLETAVGICDVLEDFCAYARKSGDMELMHQAELMWKNTGALLERCGITRIGEPGQSLDTKIHTVRGSVSSSMPREHVTEVLQTGYRYMGEVSRKATVILSTGTGDTGNEQ